MSDELHDMSDDELLGAWTLWMHHYDIDDWLTEFRRRDRRLGRRLPSPIKAWRGAHDPEGMSWTPDLHIAKTFARRNAAPLWRTTLRAGAVLAVIDNTTGWTEYVVHPGRLGRITKVTQTPRDTRMPRHTRTPRETRTGRPTSSTGQRRTLYSIALERERDRLRSQARHR